MFYLLQILKLIPQDQHQFFFDLFVDLDFERNELEWKGNEDELINDMLESHFGLSIEDEDQLKKVATIILDPLKLKLTVNAASILAI